MRKLLLPLMLVLLGSAIHAAPTGYDAATGIIHSQRWNNGVPLGGIGTGKVDLLTDGSFSNLTINHNWDRRTSFLPGSFAAISVESGGKRTARMLRLDPSHCAGTTGTVDADHNKSLGNVTADREYAGVTNVAATEYLGRYPIARVKYSDPALPVEVSLEAFSPIIPHDMKDSSLPIALFRYTITNPGTAPAEATLLFSWQNMLGWGGSRKEQWEDFAADSSTELATPELRGILFKNGSNWPDKRENTVGQYFLGIGSDRAIATILNWDAADTAIPWWDEFATTGRNLQPAHFAPPKLPASALLQTVTVPPGATRTVDVVLAWYLPVHRTELEVATPTTELKEQTDGSIAKAFDGKADTSWSTGRYQQAGDRVTFDFGTMHKFTGLTLTSARSQHDFPWGYKLETSADGVAWSYEDFANFNDTLRAQTDGTLPISLVYTPGEARFLRVTTGKTSPDRQWSIDEITAQAEGSAEPIKPVAAKVELVAMKTETRTEDVSHFYTNNFPGVTSVARYGLENRDRLLAAVEDWQRPVLESSLAPWMKTKLINSLFPLTTNTLLTKDGRYTMQESPVSMAGALGTMDQRFASHASTLMFFPELDARELDMFAACQDLTGIIEEKGHCSMGLETDGRITHFTGNVQDAIGDPNVAGGVHDWPDLSASYIMQVLKYYRWTGDREFLDHHLPHARRAMGYLLKTDHDGDHLPEGGSTFDYEPNTPGAFVYSASMYLGAIRASQELEKLAGQKSGAKRLAREFRIARESVLRDLWNGEYFLKWNDPLRKRRNENSFVAALAGSWHTELSGLEPLLPPKIEDAAIDAIVARHLKPFPLVPPMEVTPDGKAAIDACYIMQQEPFVGFEAIYRGRVTDGMEVLRRVHQATYEQNREAWSQPLWLDVSTGGARHGLVCYMTAPTTWFVLPALAGASLDVPRGTLDLNPQSPDGAATMKLPLYFPRFWATLEANTTTRRATLTVTNSFGDQPVSIAKLRVGPDCREVKLRKPFVVAKGATLDLKY